MHEMSLAEGIRQIVEDAGRRQVFQKVKTVVLEIGQLAAVEPDSLRFCLDLVLQGSIAEGAILQIDSLPGRAWCARCAETVPMAALYDACPRCGAYQLQVSAGTEMRVKELEIE